MHRPMLQRAMVAVGTIVALAACGGTSGSSSSSTPTPQADVGSGQLQGAGSTFDEPFFTKAFYQYNQDHSSVSVNYQAIGSGGGIQAFQAGTVDFRATDVPMAASDIAAAGGDAALVQVPVLLGVAAITYNLQGVDKLKLDGPTLANIYLGTVKSWNDPGIKSLNSGVSLPSTPITVVHRADSSGTSYAFTDYLAKVSPDWMTKVGVGKAVAWPTGVGASQNAGVGQQVKTTDGAIGYVELAYVIQSQLQYAYLKNADGKFVQASQAGATAAAQQAASSVSATRFSITNEPGAKSYPITTFSWVLLKTAQADANKGKALAFLWKWFVTDGQAQGKTLQYAPLPTPVQTYALNELKKITSNGKPILS